jgi:hypothetical protein
MALLRPLLDWLLAPLRVFKLAVLLALHRASVLFRGQDPYAIRPQGCRVIGPDGEVLERSANAFVFASRHGLVSSGVVCPACNHRAAEPGQYGLIRDTIRGEAILCDNCKVLILASPDDDVDPVNPREHYDESVYHRFARRGDFRPRQRTTTAKPQVGDWVVIEKFKTIREGKDHDLDGAEGRVVSEGGTGFEIALAGNTGMGGSGMGAEIVSVPFANAFPMVLPSLRVGDLVRITRGPNKGAQGTIAAMHRGTIMVETSGAVDLPLKVPIERLEKIIPNERL